MTKVIEFPKQKKPQHTEWCTEFTRTFNGAKRDCPGITMGRYSAIVDACFSAQTYSTEDLVAIAPLMDRLAEFFRLSSGVIVDVLKACRWFEQPDRATAFVLNISENHPIVVFTLGEGVYFRAQFCTFDEPCSLESARKASTKNASEDRIIVKQKFDPEHSGQIYPYRFAIPLLLQAEWTFFDHACAASFGYEIGRSESLMQAVFTRLSPDHMSCVRYGLLFDTSVFDCYQGESPGR